MQYSRPSFAVSSQKAGFKRIRIMVYTMIMVLLIPIMIRTFVSYGYLSVSIADLKEFAFKTDSVLFIEVLNAIEKLSNLQRIM